MSKLTQDDILKLAALGRLKLTDEEVEQFRDELSAILDYVEQLDNVAVENIEPTYQVSGLTNQMRPDEVDSTGPYAATSEDLLKNVPALQENQIKAKRILQ